MKYVKSKLNKERANRFEAALNAHVAYADEQIDEDARCDFGDLIVNAMHFCAQRNINFDSVLRSAQQHFDIERHGKE